MNGITIRPIAKNEDAKAFQQYINEIIAEDAFIQLNHPVSIDAEKSWLTMVFDKAQQGKAGLFVAEDDGILVGISHWERGEQRESDHLIAGITVRKSHRGQGLGRILFNACIADAKKQPHHHIWLKVVHANQNAIALYEDLGFKRVATLPQWYAHKNGFQDVDIMVLSE